MIEEDKKSIPTTNNNKKEEKMNNRMKVNEDNLLKKRKHSMDKDKQQSRQLKILIPSIEAAFIKKQEFVNFQVN